MIFYRRWQPVKAVTFDLDDTFYDNHPILRIAEKAQFDFLADRYPETKDYSQDFWFSLKREVLKDFPHYVNDMIVLRKTVLRRGLIECGVSNGRLDEAVEGAFQTFSFHRSNFKVEDKVHAVLDALADKYPLVAITNGNVDVDRVGIGQYFKLTLHASLQSPMKPKPFMFDRAKDHLNLSSREVLHVGDNLFNDVWGGVNNGFRSAWYAHNREMNMAREPAKVLPDVEFSDLDELVQLLC